MAFKEGCRKAKPRCSSRHEVEVVIPEEYMGDVNRRLEFARGRIEGTECGRHPDHSSSRSAVIHVRIRDRSAFQNAGPRDLYDALRHYEEVPKQIADEIIARAQGAEVKESV
jgi:elongation factor G